MKETKLLKILVEDKSLVKLLKTIGIGKGYPTRELLTRFNSYGYGHKQILKAQKRGFVARKNIKNKVFNILTADGIKLVKLAREIGV